MKALIALIVAIIVIGGGYYWYTSQQSVENTHDMAGIDVTPEAPAPTPGTNAPTDAQSSTSASSAVKEFTVTGKNFAFAPATMTVNQGDTVRITFVNESGTHDLVVDGYNARTKVIQGGTQETIEFVADKTGTFEYYCSVGQHRQMGMKGTLTVR